MIEKAAELRGARFGNAKLDFARLMHVDLRCANLTDASVVETRFNGADLRRAVLLGLALNDDDAEIRDTRFTRLGSRDDPWQLPESCVRLLRR